MKNKTTHNSPFKECDAYKNLHQKTRIPLIARSWDPGWGKVDTQGGNGRKWESERGRERESVLKSVAFVCKMISKNHRNARSVYFDSQKAWLTAFFAIIKKANIRFKRKQFWMKSGLEEARQLMVPSKQLCQWYPISCHIHGYAISFKRLVIGT